MQAIYATLKKHPGIWITSVTVMLLLTAAGVAGVLVIAAQEAREKRSSARGGYLSARLLPVHNSRRFGAANIECVFGLLWLLQ